MSSDPKGLEPTPLTAERLAQIRQTHAKRRWYGPDGVETDDPENHPGGVCLGCNESSMKESWDCTTGHLLTTIAELQREIEGYRQTLERTVEALNAENARERRQHPDPQFASMVRDLGKRIGYGVLMTEASRLWAEEVGGGAFAVGHCISIVEAADREARRVLAGKEARNEQ